MSDTEVFGTKASAAASQNVEPRPTPSVLDSSNEPSAVARNPTQASENVWTAEYQETMETLVNETRTFHHRMSDPRRNLFTRADRNDGFTKVRQEKDLLKIIQGSVKISDEILARFEITDAVTTDGGPADGDPDVARVVGKRAQLLAKSSAVLREDITFLDNKVNNEVRAFLTDLREGMKLVYEEKLQTRLRDRLIDKYDNWWMVLHRLAERTSDALKKYAPCLEVDPSALEVDPSAWRDSGIKDLTKLLVLLTKFRKQIGDIVSVRPASPHRSQTTWRKSVARWFRSVQDRISIFHSAGKL